MLKYLIAFSIEAFISVLFIASTFNMLVQSGLTGQNYKRKNIPFPLGIAYIPVLAASLLLYLVLFSRYIFNYVLFSFFSVTIAFSGLLDDLAGDRKIKGFKQHFKALFNGSVTTGISKAFIGFIISLLSSLIISRNIVEFLVNLLVVVFFINTMNLLDVRPGRSIKVFLLYVLILSCLGIKVLQLCLPLYFICIPSVILLVYDIREKGMLGDTGSNLLGFVSGFYSAMLVPFSYKLLLIVLLVFLNILSEKKSLSEVIEKNKLLKYFDDFGRKKNEAS